ncbi:hypothetical protein QM797_17260 [Rhodococcus sp. IEGM 1381]|uniref:hypothetical protein n=1 Tax=Rhodococcus sp. IEGM 1381 TaxID=3047085 RepID=UPI0024B78D9D|nr:hypothetical protein [Rhodococcus sp. IEGM 1381]MDI9896476.1 hypothetical protein [Rhodococcus sp. IEGM 1381]
MDLLTYVVHEGCDVVGTGVVIIDASGAAHLAPNTPFPDPRNVSRTIPLRYSVFDREWDGVWVTFTGRWGNGCVDVDSVDRIDRPNFPSETTVRVTNPNGTGWTLAEEVAATEHSDLHSTDDPIVASGSQREDYGSDTLTIDCLYIDRSLAEWLGRTHPGDIEVRSTLAPHRTL